MPPLCPVGAPALGVDGGLTQTWCTCWALAGRTPQGCCARALGRGLAWGPGGRERPSWLELRAGPPLRAVRGGQLTGGAPVSGPHGGQCWPSRGRRVAAHRSGGPQHGHGGSLGPPPRNVVESSGLVNMFIQLYQGRCQRYDEQGREWPRGRHNKQISR